MRATLVASCYRQLFRFGMPLVLQKTGQAPTHVQTAVLPTLKHAQLQLFNHASDRRVKAEALQAFLSILADKLARRYARQRSSVRRGSRMICCVSSSPVLFRQDGLEGLFNVEVRLP